MSWSVNANFFSGKVSEPLIGETRRFAEARSRFAVGMTMLAAGVPMFMMGEEIGAQKPYRYSDFIDNREALYQEKETNGQRLFRFYQDIIRLRLNHSGLRSHNIYVEHVHNANRVIAFRRWDETSEFLIVGSLNNHPFTDGYIIESSQIQVGQWQEIFNSDASYYGGDNIGNLGTAISANSSYFKVALPANGFIVFQRQRGV